MYKILIRYQGSVWVEAKSGYSRDELISYAVTNYKDREYMVVSVLRHHSGEAEEFEIKG